MASKLISRKRGFGRLQSTEVVANQTILVLNNWKVDHGLQRKGHARDLGVEMHYSGPHRVGHRRDRLHEGHQRLSRLSALPVDAIVKEHVLATSIWPATFHGCELFPPSTETLASFRSEAASAIVGPSHAMNPAILLLLGDKKILDPSFYTALSQH